MSAAHTAALKSGDPIRKGTDRCVLASRGVLYHHEPRVDRALLAFPMGNRACVCWLVQKEWKCCLSFCIVLSSSVESLNHYISASEVREPFLPGRITSHLFSGLLRIASIRDSKILATSL
jgi:hypothetical protein